MSTDNNVSACIASICRVWLIWTGDIEVDDGNMADFSIRVCTW